MTRSSPAWNSSMRVQYNHCNKERKSRIATPTTRLQVCDFSCRRFWCIYFSLYPYEKSSSDRVVVQNHAMETWWWTLQSSIMPARIQDWLLALLNWLKSRIATPPRRLRHVTLMRKQSMYSFHYIHMKRTLLICLLFRIVGRKRDSLVSEKGKLRCFNLATNALAPTRLQLLILSCPWRSRILFISSSKWKEHSCSWGFSELFGGNVVALQAAEKEGNAHKNSRQILPRLLLRLHITEKELAHLFPFLSWWKRQGARPSWFLLGNVRKVIDSIAAAWPSLDPRTAMYATPTRLFPSILMSKNAMYFFYPVGMKRALGNLLDFRIIGQKANVVALQPSKSRASSVPYLRESRQTPRSLSLPCIADRVHWWLPSILDPRSNSKAAM